MGGDEWPTTKATLVATYSREMESLEVFRAPPLGRGSPRETEVAARGAGSSVDTSTAAETSARSGVADLHDGPSAPSVCATRLRSCAVEPSGARPQVSEESPSEAPPNSPLASSSSTSLTAARS